MIVRLKTAAVTQPHVRRNIILVKIRIKDVVLEKKEMKILNQIIVCYVRNVAMKVKEQKTLVQIIAASVVGVPTVNIIWLNMKQSSIIFMC